MVMNGEFILNLLLHMGTFTAISIQSIVHGPLKRSDFLGITKNPLENFVEIVQICFIYAAVVAMLLPY